MSGGQRPGLLQEQGGNTDTSSYSESGQESREIVSVSETSGLSERIPKAGKVILTAAVIAGIYIVLAISRALFGNIHSGFAGKIPGMLHKFFHLK